MKIFAFLLFPALELYLLVKVGAAVGALNMVLWVFASIALGVWAIRTQGQGVLFKVQASLAAGEAPQQSFLEGLLLFFGGVLLIIPGLVSDAAGLLLLLPPVRSAAARALGAYLASRRPAPGSASGSRVFFFRSGGFPGAGQGFGHNTQDFDSIRPEQRLLYEDEGDDEPRRAVVIDSTAVEITATEDKNDDVQEGDGK